MEEHAIEENRLNKSIPTMIIDHDDDVIMGSARDVPGDSLITPTTRANLEPTATVKFHLISINQVITKAYSLSTHLKELKKDLSSNLKMHPDHLMLIHENNRKFSYLLHLKTERTYYMVNWNN